MDLETGNIGNRMLHGLTMPLLDGYVRRIKNSQQRMFTALRFLI